MQDQPGGEHGQQAEADFEGDAAQELRSGGGQGGREAGTVERGQRNEGEQEQDFDAGGDAVGVGDEGRGAVPPAMSAAIRFQPAWKQQVATMRAAHRPSSYRQRPAGLKPLAWGCLGLALVAGGGWFLLQTADFASEQSFGDVIGAIPIVAQDTRFGILRSPFCRG